MNCISITYELKFQFKKAKNYKVTKCGKVFNDRTGRKIKKSYKSGSVAYWLRINNKSVFFKVGDNTLLERIPKQDSPF